MQEIPENVKKLLDDSDFLYHYLRERVDNFVRKLELEVVEKEAEERAIEKGRQKVKKEVACKMLENGCDLNAISSATKLSIEQIQNIKNSLEAKS